MELVLTFIPNRCKHLCVSFRQNWDSQLKPAPPHRRPTKPFKHTWCVHLTCFCIFLQYIQTRLVRCDCVRSCCDSVLQDACQQLEKLKGAILSLSAGARRLSDKEQAERTVTELSSSYESSLQEAKDKQSSLENLLCLWQKYDPSTNTFVHLYGRSKKCRRNCVYFSNYFM